MNSKVFPNLNDSVQTQPASLILHNNKEATACVQKVKVALPAFPPDSSCTVWFLHAAPVLLKSLLSAVVGYLSTFLPCSVRHFLSLNWYKRFNKLQNVPTQGLEGQSKCPTGSDEQLHQQTPCGEIKPQISVWLKTTGAAEEGKAQVGPGRVGPGREGRGNHSSSSAPGIPFHCPGMALSALLTFLLLNFKSARRACKFCFPSTEPALRHLSSFKCSCSFNWPEAVDGGKQQLLWTCLECSEADDYR